MDSDEVQRRLANAADRVFKAFAGSGRTLCAAESCTGGLVGSSIVAISGASAFFKGSAVCYCDDAKISILEVSRATLEKHFAESAECAKEMALGAARIFGATAAVSTTGFLDANVGDKPADLKGTVFVCVALDRGGKFDTFASRVSLDPSAPRNVNRAIVAACALESLSLALSSV